MKNILIVEDEAVLAERLARMIVEILPKEQTRLQIKQTIEEARHALSTHRFDLVFLDLDLVGEDGFDLVRESIAEGHLTIVVSGHTHRAIEAFDLGLVDFVAKPFDQNRIVLAIRRAEQRDKKDSGIILVESRGSIEPVAINDIYRVEAAGNYVLLKTRDRADHLHSQTMASIEAELPGRFLRIHRSHIVDRFEIRSIDVEPGGKYSCCLDNGDRLPLGRTRIDHVKQSLKDSL